MSGRASRHIDPELRAILRESRRTERRLEALAGADDAPDPADDDRAGVRDALERREAERPKPQGCGGGTRPPA